MLKKIPKETALLVWHTPNSAETQRHPEASVFADKRWPPSEGFRLCDTNSTGEKPNKADETPKGSFLSRHG